MQRVQRQDQAEWVGNALQVFPPRMRWYLEGVDVFFGDHVFAGLHSYGGIAGKRSDGTEFTYRQCLHFVAPWKHRPSTVVVPPHVRFDTWDLAHEFGHALDNRLSEPSGSLCVAPITRYGATNAKEAFAEAVAALVVTTDARRFRRDSYLAWFRCNASGFLEFFESLC